MSNQIDPVIRVTRSKSAAANTKSLPKPEQKEHSEPDTPESSTKSRKGKSTKTKPKNTKPEETPLAAPQPFESDGFEEALARLKQVQEDKKKLNIKDVQALRKKFKQTCETAKRETQIIEQQQAAKQPGFTRSGAKRGHVQQPTFTDGKWINKGLDDAADKFDADELKYLKEVVGKVKKVNELKFEHLKYLVCDVLLDELKDIKAGKTESEFHERYGDLSGKSKMDLFSEIRTSLFTNEQRDYINGLLQGAFETASKDCNGDIKHKDIHYVVIVMFAEITIRIVRFVHKFKTNSEAFEYMIQSSHEALGVCNDQ